jgi:hypothetical protein
MGTGQDMQIVDDGAAAETRRDSCAHHDSVRVGLATGRHGPGYAQLLPVHEVERVLAGSAAALATR